MWAINLRIFGVVLGTILAFTLVANVIPQVQSDVPEELHLSADVTPDELVAIGEQLFFGAGNCTACHGTGVRAPNLIADEGGLGAIGSRCGMRVPGMSCKEYLWQSLVDPNAAPVEGYPPIMPDMRRTLSEPQLWALVAYMESVGGTVTVTAADIGDLGASPTTGPAPAAAPGVAVTGTDPLELLQAHQCLLCHQLAGEGGPIGPPLDGVGARLDVATIREAILDPNARVSPGYEAFAGTMPANFGAQMTAAQLEAVVRYLAGLR